MRLKKLTLIALSSLGLYLAVGEKSPTLKSATASSLATENSATFKAILLGSRTTPLKPIQANVVSEPCQNLWDQIRQTDLQRLNEEVFRGCLLLPETSACSGVPAELSSVHETYATACSIFLDRSADKTAVADLDDKAQACFLALVAYRSAVGSWLSADQPLSSIQEVQVLGDRLLNEMLLSQRGGVTSVDKLAEIAARINEVNPGIYATTKIVAIGHLTEAMGNPSPESWEKARRAAEQLESLSNNDPEIKQLALWARTEGLNPQKLHEEARLMVKDNPKSGLGYFYLAFAEAGLGNRSRVEALFLDAVEAEPNNPTFVRALENFRAHRPVPPPFDFDFNLKLSELMGRG